MRKASLFLSAALLLGGSYQARAQYKGRGGNTSLGIKAGAVLTSYVGPETKSGGSNLFNYRFGFQAGLFANVGFSKLFAVQPELLYSQRGADYNGLGGDQGERLHYIDVPLAFHVNTDGFFLEAGPQVGFLVRATQYKGTASRETTSIFQTVDVGYLAGVGYQKKHGPGIGFRYNGGFSNVLRDYTVLGVTYQERQRNSAFQLYATYSFN